MKYPKYFDTIKAAAAAMSQPPSLLKTWKGMGCPAFRHGRVFMGELLAWLKEKKIKLPKPAKRPAPPPAVITLPKASDASTAGAGPALARLEQSERELHSAMVAAMAASDTQSADGYRKAWLEVSGELRKYDSQVSDARRVHGDTVQKQDMERWLHFLGVHWDKACYLVAVSVASRLQVMAENPAKALDDIRTGLSNSFLTSLAALAALQCPARVPEWIVKAMVKPGSEEALADRTEYFKNAIEKGLK